MIILGLGPHLRSRRPPRPSPPPATGFVTVVGEAGAGALAPASTTWGGKVVNISGGATSFPGMQHAVQVLEPGREVIRTEVRNTEQDRREADPLTTRRSEWSDDRYRFPNVVRHWFAISIFPVSYAKPLSMAETTGFGGPVIQVHGDDDASPLLSPRRTSDDQLSITTAGNDEEGQGTQHWKGPWLLDQWNDLVGWVEVHPTNGGAFLALNGTPIPNIPTTGLSLGPSNPGLGFFMKGGGYHRGLGSDPLSTVINYHANYVRFTTTDLSSRISSPPTFPTLP